MTLFDELIALRDKQRLARVDEPVVVQGHEIPWEDCAQGRIRWYLHPAVEGPPRAFIMYTQTVPSGHKSGRLLAQGGTLLYLLNGELVTTVGDETYHWRAGDLLTLPILRDGVTYQHLNFNAEQPAELLALEVNTAAALGVDKGCGLELREPAGKIMPEDVPACDGSTRDLRADSAQLSDGPDIDPSIDIQYHRDIERWQWIRARNERGRLLIRGDDMPWEQNRQGRVKYYLNPEFKENAIRDWTFFLHDIKTHTGMHRHQGGILIYVVEGEGYTLVDGTRHDWSKGDLILLPIKPGGVEHEHHNLRPGGNCRWIASFYWPWWELVASEFTQVREHPDFVPVSRRGAAEHGKG